MKSQCQHLAKTCCRLNKSIPELTVLLILSYLPPTAMVRNIEYDESSFTLFFSISGCCFWPSLPCWLMSTRSCSLLTLFRWLSGFWTGGFSFTTLLEFLARRPEASNCPRRCIKQEFSYRLFSLPHLNPRFTRLLLSGDIGSIWRTWEDRGNVIDVVASTAVRATDEVSGSIIGLLDVKNLTSRMIIPLTSNRFWSSFSASMESHPCSSYSPPQSTSRPKMEMKLAVLQSPRCSPNTASS